jgi:hypothetical protein
MATSPSKLKARGGANEPMFAVVLSVKLDWAGCTAVYEEDDEFLGKISKSYNEVRARVYTKGKICHHHDQPRPRGPANAPCGEGVGKRVIRRFFEYRRLTKSTRLANLPILPG